MTETEGLEKPKEDGGRRSRKGWRNENMADLFVQIRHINMDFNPLRVFEFFMSRKMRMPKPKSPCFVG